MEFRTRQLKKYTQRAAQLVSDGQKFKKSLDVDVRGVLEDKRLLLFKEMSYDAGVGDENLFQELVEGFRLTEEMPQSRSFPAQFKPAQISVQQLKGLFCMGKEDDTLVLPTGWSRPRDS